MEIERKEFASLRIRNQELIAESAKFKLELAQKDNELGKMKALRDSAVADLDILRSSQEDTALEHFRTIEYLESYIQDLSDQRLVIDDLENQLDALKFSYCSCTEDMATLKLNWSMESKANIQEKEELNLTLSKLHESKELEQRTYDIKIAELEALNADHAQHAVSLLETLERLKLQHQDEVSKLHESKELEQRTYDIKIAELEALNADHAQHAVSLLETLERLKLQHQDDVFVLRTETRQLESLLADSKDAVTKVSINQQEMIPKTSITPYYITIQSIEKLLLGIKALFSNCRDMNQGLPLLDEIARFSQSSVAEAVEELGVLCQSACCSLRDIVLNGMKYSISVENDYEWKDLAEVQNNLIFFF